MEHERNNLLAHGRGCHAAHSSSVEKDKLGGSKSLRHPLLPSCVKSVSENAVSDWRRGILCCQEDRRKPTGACRDRILSIIPVWFLLGYSKTRTFRHCYVSIVIQSSRDTGPETSGEITPPGLQHSVSGTFAGTTRYIICLLQLLAAIEGYHENSFASSCCIYSQLYKFS